jgi:Ca2+-binding RTX toxin-like protein
MGGPGKDSLTGDAGADVMKGMNGNDQLFARDLTSDTTINCDGGIGTPGSADKADLDQQPKDSPPSGCETVTRHGALETRFRTLLGGDEVLDPSSGAALPPRTPPRLRRPQLRPSRLRLRLTAACLRGTPFVSSRR